MRTIRFHFRMHARACQLAPGVLAVIATVTAVACRDPLSPTSQHPQISAAKPHAIENGHDMSNDHEARSGLVRIYVWGGGLSTGCTATVLKTSKITNDAWLLTAAHCFYSVDKYDFEVHRVGATLSVSVDTAPGRPGTAMDADSKIYVHPDWDRNVDGGFGIWYDHPDVALVHFKQYVPVVNEYDTEYQEYTRPFLASTTERYEGDDVGVFGARDELRWARGTFKESPNSYLVIDGNDWATADAEIEHGDSGGPWLYSTGGESSAERYVVDGVVVGVTSGGFPDPSAFAWLPVDSFAANLSSATTTNFILDKTNGAVPTVDNLPWRRQPTAQYSLNGKGGWTPLVRSSRSTGHIAVADFGPSSCDAGMPRDDLFLAENGRWFISWCGNSKWIQIGTSTTEVRDKYGLAFGDFNGDGKADVFRASGGEWKVSYSGNTPWTTLKVSSTELKDDHGLGFGDFNGDGKTDVFRANGTEWNVSYSGTGAWTVIKSSTTELTDEHGLLIGDFNGDGKSDVFRANGTEWNVSYGGVGGWTKLKDSGKTTRELAVGNLAGDAGSEIVLARNPITCDTVFGNFCKAFFYLNNTAP